MQLRVEGVRARKDSGSVSWPVSTSQRRMLLPLVARDVAPVRTERSRRCQGDLPLGSAAPSPGTRAEQRSRLRLSQTRRPP